MSDERLRELERNGEREKLEREWVRRGLGWHMESLPRSVYTSNERGVYFFAIPRAPSRVGVGAPLGADLPLVYVPGVEVECERCKAWRRDFGPYDDMANPDAPCVDCRETPGKRKIAPFYVGRFPVTWAQYEAFSPGRKVSYDEGQHAPVTLVSLDNARAFCSWAGLRLPTDYEWKWAALGAPSPCLTCRGNAGKRVKLNPGDGYPDEWTLAGEGERSIGAWVCRDCRYEGKIARRYPWGSDQPSPERCVWSHHPRYGGAFGGEAGGTAPVVVEVDGSPFIQGAPKRLVPARPAGASWCGAHDLAGNVWEWNTDRTALGGSFRTALENGHPIFNGAPMGWQPEARDDVGFRVALSAPGENP